MGKENGFIIKQLREKNGLTRREVAERSGINFRSLQDYEQGHKDIFAAKGDTLHRLSLVLGCSMEELLLGNYVDDDDGQAFQFERMAHAGERDVPVEVHSPDDKVKRRHRCLTYYALVVDQKINEIEAHVIKSPEYKVYGRWKMDGKRCYLRFCYDGEIVNIPFDMEFSARMMPWLIEVAGLKIDYYIRNKKYAKSGMMAGGETWDES